MRTGPTGRAEADQVDGLLDLNRTRFRMDDDTGILQVDEVLFLQAAQFGQDLISRSYTVEIQDHQIAHSFWLPIVCAPEVRLGRAGVPGPSGKSPIPVQGKC
jgi:hypothetical protein